MTERLLQNILRKCAHAIYRHFFGCKNENFQLTNFDIFPKLCFGAKIRKIGIPLHTPVLLYKSGVLSAVA